jgi:hypothetical protein
MHATKKYQVFLCNRFLQDSHGITFHKMAFFLVICFKAYAVPYFQVLVNVIICHFLSWLIKCLCHHEVHPTFLVPIYLFQCVKLILFPHFATLCDVPQTKTFGTVIPKVLGDVRFPTVMDASTDCRQAFRR